MKNQLPLIPLPPCGPRLQGLPSFLKANAGLRGQGVGGPAHLLLTSCYTDVLFPFYFPNERKAPIWCSEYNKGQKSSLTFPSGAAVVSVSKQHLNTCQDSESGASKAGCLCGDHTIKQPWGDLAVGSKGTPDVSCWAGGHFGNGRNGLPPLAPLNSLSAGKSSNHREHIFSGSQKSDTWKKKADKYILGLNQSMRGWDEGSAQLLLLWKHHVGMLIHVFSRAQGSWSPLGWISQENAMRGCGGFPL